MNSGIKLWKKAIKIIPGGNSILSKRPERYAPDIWPTYFKKAKGINVWDLDGKKYLDMAQMGIGSSILGYSNAEVNKAVSVAINEGISTTLNSKDELILAKKLLKLNKGFSSVKFARSGGEAMSIAVRIARAYKKNSKIAFSGYHGWFDWYLATNLEKKSNLNQHLLPGLSTAGIPKSLKGSIYPFSYDDPKDFIRLLNKVSNIKIIVMESGRNNFPKKEFVETIMKIVKRKKLILICDEITTGFRSNGKGLYKKVGLDPDLVVYGKGLGNGFAISAVVGKKNIMKSAQNTFISSSNWSERVGFVAASKTLDIIQKKKTWIHINNMGKVIAEGWKKIFKKYKLDITVSNFYPLVTMKLNYNNLNNLILTYFIQEMLKKGYLATSSIYVSYAHNEKDIKKYLRDADKVFEIISKNLNYNFLKKKLKTKVRTDSFKRL